MLVTSFEGFTRYQQQTAETWEHLALLRARAVAGDVARAQSGLEAMRERIVRAAANPWPYVGDMRGRVVAERGVEDGKKSALKAGRGGIMDVEFLAAGALLERGLQLGGASLPAVPAMLRAALPDARVEPVIADYAVLRRVEACARWLAGRAQETIPRGGEAADAVADLLRPGMPAAELSATVDAARARIASAFEAVAERATIEALAG
jgi:glutamate-ammonia-ligase adenylyltransferase